MRLQAKKALVLDSSAALSGVGNLTLSGDLKVNRSKRLYLNDPDVSNFVYLNSSVNNDLQLQCDSPIGSFTLAQLGRGTFQGDHTIFQTNSSASFYKLNWDLNNWKWMSNQNITFANNGIDLMTLYANSNRNCLIDRLTVGTTTSTANTAQCNIIASSTFPDGASYYKGLRISSTNASPVQYEVQVSNGTSATSTNAAFIGTLSNNDLGFMTNNTRRMTLDISGRLGLNTTSPSALLDISGGVSITIDSGGSGYGTATRTAYTGSAGIGPSSFMIGLRATSNIACASVYVTSDRRVKKILQN